MKKEKIVFMGSWDRRAGLEPIAGCRRDLSTCRKRTKTSHNCQTEREIYIYTYIYAISAKCFAPHCTGMLMSMSTYIPVRDRRTKNYLHNRKAPGKCSMQPFRQSCGFEHAGDAGPHLTRRTNSYSVEHSPHLVRRDSSKRGQSS